jgi:hypothetical protein
MVLWISESQAQHIKRLKTEGRVTPHSQLEFSASP